MDFTEEADASGICGSGSHDTTQLVLYRNTGCSVKKIYCGCYNVNPACPPESGTVEEMKQRALQYEKNSGAADHAGRCT